MENYMQSKAGNVFLAAETGRRLGKDGIISVVRFSGGLLQCQVSTDRAGAYRVSTLAC